MTLGIRNGHTVWCLVFAATLSIVVAGLPPQPASAQDAVAAVPRGLTIEGVGCLAPSPSRLSGLEPSLAGTPLFGAAAVQARIEVRTAASSTNLRTWTSAAVTSGDQVEWQIEPALPEDGNYRWRMRSEDPSSGASSQWTGWCEFTANSDHDQPEAEEPPEVECPTPVGDEPLQAATESAALLLAEACDSPVEAMSERDFGSRVLARPDGVLVAEEYAHPQWAPDGEGEWADVDSALEVKDDGRIATVAAVSEVNVSPGGNGPLVTMTDPDGGSMSVTWPDSLPPPVLEGTTATYPEVIADVDLQVDAGVDGFSYILIVKSAAAAASPELQAIDVEIETDGDLSVDQETDGTVTVEDTDGEVVFSAPAAYMWDSSTPEELPGPAAASVEEGSGLPGDGGPGRFTEMPLQLSNDTLTIEPDQELLSDPDVEFPVMIDPPFSGKRMHWANVHQQQPNRGWTDDSSWPREKEMRVGRLGHWSGQPCGNACGLWRSAIRFNINSLSNREIISAEVKATQVHTSGCGTYGLELYYVTAFTSGVTWNQMDSRWRDRLNTRSIPSSNRAGGCSGTKPEGVTFSSSALKNRVQSHADAGHASLSFGFRSQDESSIRPYRRIAIGSVKLEVEYNRPAQQPISLSTDGRGCSTSSPGPWLSTQRPTLSGKPRDPDGRVGAHLQIRRVGSSSTHYAWRTATNRTHNKVVNHRIPSGDRLASGDYRWRMRSLDSHSQGSDSSWRQWCYFRVDATAPTTPTVEVLGDPPAAGEEVTLRLRSSDAHSGLASLQYGVDEEVKRHTVTSSGTATITVTAPPSGGRTWIYVWSRDKAGNSSKRALFDFFASRYVEATPAAAWRLDGDGFDDSGNGHELHLGGGVSWSGSSAVEGHASLEFDGTGCVSTESPVVRTDAEYTVTAWVRMDSDSGPYAVIAPAGQVRPGFTLRYNSDEDRWIFVLGSHDDEDTTFATLRSAGPPDLNTWTHLAVRVDPAARHMQMYVNGELSSEREIPWVTWNASGPVYVGCSGPETGDTWGHFNGGIHHVGVWQGLLTPGQIQDAYEGEMPAGQTGEWQLRGDGTDASPYGRDLSAPAGGWVNDQYGRQRSAMNVDGSDWAEADGPVVRTDQSFTVSAWAKLDEKNEFHTVASQGGVEVTTFNLNYHPDMDRWQLSMSTVDDLEETLWHRAQSTAAPEIGRWYHLVGVFDRAAGEIRLYVDGELQSTADGPDVPWQGDGPFLVGTGGNSSGERSNRMVGSISDVKTWRGALSDQRVAEEYGGNPAVQQVANWSLNGNGTDSVGGHSLTLAGSEGVDYEWVEDRFCFPWNALGLHLSGQAHAKTTSPVVNTDESFTVGGWVKLESLTGAEQTVLSQGGGGQSGLRLLATSDGRWRFAMAEEDAAGSAWAAAETAAGTVQEGVWTYLTGVFDIGRGEMRLYVDGELVDTGDAVASPWLTDGPFFIGAAGLADGSTSQHLSGVVDSVSVWTSTLDPDRIADIGVPPMSPGICL